MKTLIKILLLMTIITILEISSGFYILRWKTIEKSFLDQIGISQPDADLKIKNSVLGGFLDQQGVAAAKKILKSDRRGVTLDLLNYTRKYLGSPEFEQAYESLREKHKPVMQQLQTPEEMQAEMVDRIKVVVTESEENWRNADASMKNVFESVMNDAKKMLLDAENLNSAQMVAYRQNYQEMMNMIQQSQQQQIATWEADYPADPDQFIKKRLQQFLEETRNIDFSAQLTEKNKKMVFVNPEYEAKGFRWKLAFRAGQEVIVTAREYVEKWIKELS